MRVKLSLTAFSLACALLGTLHLGLLVLLSFFGFGSEIVSLLSGLLPGIETSGPGFFVAITWGFLIGGGYGFILTWLYNKML